MILALEIMLTVGGLWMLCTGRTWGKNTVSHWQLRLMGGLMMTVVPMVFVIGIIGGIVFAIKYPDLTPAQFEAKFKWPAIIIEIVTVLLYAGVAVFWESRVRKMLAAAAEAEPLAAGDYPS